MIFMKIWNLKSVILAILLLQQMLAAVRLIIWMIKLGTAS